MWVYLCLHYWLDHAWVSIAISLSLLGVVLSILMIHTIIAIDVKSIRKQFLCCSKLLACPIQPCLETISIHGLIVTILPAALSVDSLESSEVPTRLLPGLESKLPVWAVVHVILSEIVAHV